MRVLFTSILALLFVPSICIAKGDAVLTHCNQCTEVESSLLPALAWQTVAGSTLTASNGDYSYSFCAIAGRTYDFSFCQQGGTSDYDSGISVFPLAGTACGVLLDCVDDICGLSAELSFTPAAGGQYVVKVGGFGGSTGNYVLAYRGAPCNAPPDCDAGGPYSVACGGLQTSIPLDGTGSSDPEGDPLSFAWSSSCPGASFDNPASPTPTLTVNTSGGGIIACVAYLDVSDGRGGVSRCSSSVSIDCRNQSPDCAQAVATLGTLWPPNHRMVAVGVTGVTDPDGDPITITVTGITQDEPLDTRGDGNTCPDGQIVSGQASVRAERSGTPGIPGNGRVYVISFTASDGKGGECTGSVSVCVPHDQGAHSTCVDDGQTYNSLGPCNGGSQLSQEVTEVGLTVGTVTGTRAALEFALPQDTQVEVGVFDLAGRRLATVASGTLAAGVYQRSWDMSGATKGLYFVRLRAGAVTLTRTVVKIR